MMLMTPCSSVRGGKEFSKDRDSNTTIIHWDGKDQKLRRGYLLIVDGSMGSLEGRRVGQ